ncbi:MAG: hypothetical protein O8C61_10910 [Candidatus Methanoperedens sp.]|nr:hypothetical protein [Candidatus Methanoperedens sp.]
MVVEVIPELAIITPCAVVETLSKSDKNKFKGHALRIVVGITALVLLLANGVSAETPISACTEISSPGTYVLTQNIVTTTNLNCIIIAQQTFEGFLAPIQPIAYDPANNRITLHRSSVKPTSHP